MTTGTRGSNRARHTVDDVTIIHAAGLTKRYHDLVAVDHLDLTIGAGERVAILGPNGAGKSTTIEMLLGLRTPTSGTVTVFGTAPGHHGAKARIGAMLQDSDVPEALTVAETVDLVRHYYPMALPVTEVLARADLVDKRSSRVSQLSGGQRQRLSFALSICGDPDLLFLDEPTAALDVEARNLFWDQVRGLADAGKTVLFSTHNLAEADALAQRILVISRGRVIADGTPAQVKGKVAASTVDLATSAPLALLESAPGVQTVLDGPPDRHTGVGLVSRRVLTSQPEELLRRVFSGGYDVAALQVTEADLETAFLHLVATDHHDAAQPPIARTDHALVTEATR